MVTRKAEAAPRALSPKNAHRLEFLRQMILIRRFEERAAEAYTQRKVAGFLHLYIGQEATAVGAIGSLQPQDFVISHYREHGHALARGMSPDVIMAELYGRATGCSGGRGGSMHLFDRSKRFMGGYAIVGGETVLAVGLALASQYRKQPEVTLNFFGDGSVNEGEFHEALNLASLWKLPVVFFCENNFFGMGTAIARASAVTEIARRADAYNIPARVVDGMDPDAVYAATDAAVRHARDGNGPFFIECQTYRFRGHSMADAVLYRTKAEEEVWRQRDPIENYARRLGDEGFLPAEALQAMRDEVEGVIDAAVQFAEESPEPDVSTLGDMIYAPREAQ